MVIKFNLIHSFFFLNTNFIKIIKIISNQNIVNFINKYYKKKILILIYYYLKNNFIILLLINI